MRVLVPTEAEHPLLRPMTREDIPVVLAFERAACPHPSHAWSDDNYRSSLASGYWVRVCSLPGGPIVGVCVAMFGVDELHLLNIAVDASCHGQGLATHMLDRLQDLCRAHGLSSIWLEVRPSNTRARQLYERLGFAQVGLRKQYYPAVEGREDALVMKQEVALDAPLD